MSGASAASRSKVAVDVAFLFERLDHVTGPLVERMDDAELSRALNQRRLRLKHGRKGLIEIGRNLAEILPVRFRRQSQRRTDLMDIGKRGDNVRASRQQDSLPPVVLRPWGIVRSPPVWRPGRSRPEPARARPCSCRRRQPWRAARRPGCRRPPSRAPAPGAGSWPPLRCRALWPSQQRAQPSPYLPPPF